MGKKIGILIVEDSPTQAAKLQHILENESYEVTWASNGKMALEKMEHQKPALVLTDVSMPLMDGFELCHAIKSKKEFSKIPVIFLTACNSTKDESRSLELGAADFISKPLNPPVVLARVKNHLHLQKIRDLLEERNQLIIKNQEATMSIHQASVRIQEALLPRSSPVLDRLKVLYRFLPGESIGGDIFNFFALDEKHLGIFILDVVGKGLPAAAIATSVFQVMQPTSGILIEHFPLPAKIISPSKVITRLAQDFHIERFQTCFSIAYLVLNLETGSLASCTAGHPHPMIVRKDGDITNLTQGGPLIGIRNFKFAESVEKLEPGDWLFLYTDGLTGLCNFSNELFGLKPVTEILKSWVNEPLSANLDRIINSVGKFSGGRKPKDDIILVGYDYEKNQDEPSFES